MALPSTALHALHDQAFRLGDRPALWSKRNGTWLATSWRDHAKRVRHFALGLVGLGLEPGETVGLIAFNSDAWVTAHLGAMAAGGIPFGIYVTSSEERVRDTLAHAGASIAIVQDAELARQVLALRGALPKLRSVVVIDPAGGLPDGSVGFNELVARGASGNEQRYWERVDALRPETVATLVYKGGEGPPRAIMLSHRNLLWTARKLHLAHGLSEERFSSYLPLAHISEQLISIIGPMLLTSGQVYFSSGTDALVSDLREARPTVFFGVPRVWERFMARAERLITAVTPSEAKLWGRARRISTQFHTRQLAGAPVGGLLEAEMTLLRGLVFDRFHARMGLDRCRLFVSATAPLRREVLDFFLSLDVPIREVYGLTEASGAIAVNIAGATQLGRPGRPLLGVEVRIADDGEILARGENVCLGYFREPEASAALLADGWLHTGDLGELDREGYLRLLKQQHPAYEPETDDVARQLRASS